MPNRKTDAVPLALTQGDRLALYATRRFMNGTVQQKLGLRIPFDVYFQDPSVAAANPALAFDENCYVPWEPHIGDGPTSARLAVVDYDAHTESLGTPAAWDSKTDQFKTPGGKVVDKNNPDTPQFHQVNVWAIAQRTLDFFESGFALGRRIDWGFQGNRLILVPHAGPGKNAYYDRESHSLQFYYFDSDDGKERIYTCLSTDIVSHEFGHAVLDGIRPYYSEAVLPETAAFHEFIGDLTAILGSLRNNAFRKHLIEETKGDLSKGSTLTNIAEQFGKNVSDKPYLRTALSELKMKDVVDDQRPHYMSQVMTAAMFDIIISVSRYQVDQRKRTVPQAFWDTIQRMQAVAIQPLDLLPPVDVTFRDYALAVLRADEIASSTDPDNYRGAMLDAFVARGILTKDDKKELSTPHHIFERLDMDVFHDAEVISTSRANAYRFLDDNRRKLLIPPGADVIVSGLSTAQKLIREARRLPKQIVVQYIWREDVLLEGLRFGRFEGQMTSMLCGATLALDQNGEVLAWARKAGTQSVGISEDAIAEQQRGESRKAQFLDALAMRVKAGRIGTLVGGEKGIIAQKTPPIIVKSVDGALRFELAPHFGIHDDATDEQGGRSWQISS